ncbi:MAG TPA: hypothetical protein VH915_10965 [Pedococcus sp.]|jgi:hypothetical protein
MPPADPQPRRSLDTALQALRETARDGADELLDLFPELGERTVQVALDTLLEQAADVLRALDAEAGELAARARITGAAGRRRVAPATDAEAAAAHPAHTRADVGTSWRSS